MGSGKGALPGGVASSGAVQQLGGLGAGGGAKSP